MEEWKTIYCNENYEVSNLGRVRNKETLRIRSCEHRNKYPVFIYFKNKKRYKVFVHKLVVIAFIMPNYEGSGLVINHINEDRSDNRLSNLEVITLRQNGIHSINKNKTTSKHIGVYLNVSANKWHSQLRFKNKGYYLGLFDNEDEAGLAYQNKLKELTSIHGDLCDKLNR